MPDTEVQHLRRVRRASQAETAAPGIGGRRVLLRRAIRRRELLRYSGLDLACLIIDYGVLLVEESDPIEAILDCEAGLQLFSQHSA